jgi:hypothetical protein
MMLNKKDEQVNSTDNNTVVINFQPVKLEKSDPTTKRRTLPSFKWLETIADFIYNLFT